MASKTSFTFCCRQKQLCFQLHFVLSSCSAISNNTSSVISREKAKKRRAHFPYFFFSPNHTILKVHFCPKIQLRWNMAKLRSLEVILRSFEARILKSELALNFLDKNPILAQCVPNKLGRKLRKNCSDSAVNVLICVVFPLAGVLIDRSHVNRIILWKCAFICCSNSTKWKTADSYQKGDGSSIITPGVQKWRVFTAVAIYIPLAFFFKYRRKNSPIWHTNSKEAKYCI